MKIKRFTAATMQAGLKTISGTLGPEAVILSNRRLASGLEIIAGVEEQEYERYRASQPEAFEESQSDIIKANTAGEPPLDKAAMTQLFSALSEKNKQAFKQASEPVGLAAKPKSTGAASGRLGQLATSSQQPSSGPSFELLRQEIDGLKSLLVAQGEQARQLSAPVAISPKYERLEARLLALGFSPSLTRKLLADYDKEQPFEQNWRTLLMRLAAAVPVSLYDPLAKGGVFTFHGPTGAGKTTTIAKLAAHAVKDYGADKVAVISLDWFQLGGQEALRSVCNILGIAFYPLSERDSLAEVLGQLASRRLVLVDTSGSSEALQQWNELMTQRQLAHQMRSLLVLPATLVPAAIAQFVAAQPGTDFTAAILTKLDESACFGGVLESAIKQRLPLWYCTDGQRIPQDIAPASANRLVKRLVTGLKDVRTEFADAS